MDGNKYILHNVMRKVPIVSTSIVYTPIHSCIIPTLRYCSSHSTALMSNMLVGSEAERERERDDNNH